MTATNQIDFLRERMTAAREQILKPPSRMRLPEWADAKRRLSASAGAIGGPWRTSRVEIARGPMMAVHEPGVKTITCKVATQTLKTELLLNIIGYFADLDPCPMLFTLPKDEAVKAFSKERLAPMIRATTAIKKLFNARTRQSDDTLTYKEFPGGFLSMVSAGSPMNLAMRPIRITLADEVDKYSTLKDEGDPIRILEERTSTFRHNALHVRTSSPTIEETSRIEASYREGDQRLPFVACPHCSYEQTLDFFKHIHWNKSEDGEHYPMTAAIYCERCGEEWSEVQRLQMMTTKSAIRWRQTRPFVCCEVRQEPLKVRKWKWDAKNHVGLACCEHCGKHAVPNTHASFTASKLFSPFITVAELAAKWVECKDDPEAKQTFYNTQLGLSYHGQSLRKIETNQLTERRETYSATVPKGVLVLTAGVDVQPGSEVTRGRVEIEVVGWGLGEESWSIAHKVIDGDPAKPDIWRELDQYLLQGFEYEGGGHMVIRGVCVDSGGHNTQDVYKFARERMARNVWAIKGASDRGGQWSPVWPIPKLEPRKTRLTGYRPVSIGVNAAKESIRQRLLIDEHGPGFCHFSEDVPDARFEQLTAEQLVIEKRGGATIRKWVLKRGRANETLDCRVYAYAALCGLYAVRKLKLERLAELIETFGTRTDETAPTPTPKPSAAPPSRVRRSAFVG